MSGFFRLLLWPLTLFWNFGSGLHRFLYFSGVLARYQSPLKTISVGNLSTGGTGKTPFSALIMSMLMKEGETVAYLSRGYGRKSKGLVEVSVDSTPTDVGDEALWIKRKFPDAQVIVSESRVNGLYHIEASKRASVVILDDAHQHYSVRAGCYLLLTVAARPFHKDRLLPLGRLRESRQGARRADAILVTKCTADSDIEALKNELEAYATNLFFTTQQPDKVWKSVPTGAEFHPVMNQPVIAFSGIATNQDFFDQLKDSCQLLDTVGFRDHQMLTTGDQEMIVKRWKSAIEKVPSTVLVTTEKDASRLQKEVFEGPFKGLPLFSQGVSPAFLFSQRKSFEKLILDYVTRD